MKYLAGIALVLLLRWLWRREDPCLRDVDRLLAMRKTYGYSDNWEGGIYG